MGIPEATYHYHVKNFGKEDADAEIKELIRHLFKQFHERHGYKLVSYEELKRWKEDYIYWYNNERSKEKLTGLSPVQYRT